VGWFAADEWLAYSINVQSEGVYTIQARVGSALPGRTFRIEIDGCDVTGPVAVPQLADWDQYDTVRIANVHLHAGPQVLHIVMGPESFMDLQWIAFVRDTSGAAPGPFGGSPRLVPGRIEAEDYDLGGQGVGYADTTPGNEQGFDVYRTDDVDIKASREGGYSIGWLAAGEWLAYTIEVPRDGIYRMKVRVGSALPGRTFHIEANGRDVTGQVSVPQTADWDLYETVRIDTVRLAAGRQVLRIVMGPDDFMDLQWIIIGQ
jgi:hypothetical protein